MMVCIDKITCARMLQLIEPCWKAKATEVRAAAGAKRMEAAEAAGNESRPSQAYGEG